MSGLMFKETRFFVSLHVLSASHNPHYCINFGTDELSYEEIDEKLEVAIERYEELVHVKPKAVLIKIKGRLNVKVEKELTFNLHFDEDGDCLIVNWGDDILVELDEEIFFDRFIKKQTLMGFAYLALERGDKTSFLNFSTELQHYKDID